MDKQKKKTRNYGWILILIILVILVGGVFLVINVVKEGNNFSACVKSLAVENCHDKGMDYFTHDNFVSMDNFYGDEIYECVENPINNYKPFLENYHEYNFEKLEVEKC
jgi:hypothetical protein